MMSGVREVDSSVPLAEAAFSGVLDVTSRLGDFDSVTGFLDAGRSAFHAYELDGRAGNQLRLRLTSQSFHAVAFIVLVSSSGARFCKVVPSVAESSPGGVETQPPVTFPTDGAYRVIVTSIENQAERRAASSGEYRMTIMVDAPSVELPVDSERGTRFSAWETDSN